MSCTRTKSVRYSESIEYLYSRHTFRFSTVPDVFSLDQVFLKQRLRCLRSLTLELPHDDLLYLGGVRQDIALLPEWPRICSYIATFPCLKQLQVALLCVTTQSDGSRLRTTAPGEERTDWVLRPLEDVKSVPEFDVRLHWEVTDVSRFSNVPYTLWWRDGQDHWRSFASERKKLWYTAGK